MARKIIKSRKTSVENRKNSFLGLSVISLSGFSICRMVDKEFLRIPLAKRKALKEIFCFKKTR